MATPAQLEAAFTARFRDRIPGLVVKPFPNDVSTHKLLGKSELLLVYRGGPFETPRRTDLVVQERTVNFEAVLAIQSLDGHTGAYELLEQIRLAVQGWKPLPECEPVRIVRDQFLDERSGQWYWAVFFSTRFLSSPARAEASDPPIRQIAFQSPGGTFQVP